MNLFNTIWNAVVRLLRRWLKRHPDVALALADLKAAFLKALRDDLGGLRHMAAS